MGSQRYKSDAIVVSYDVKRCIHAAECVHGLPEVFDPERRPWVQLEGAVADRVARVIERCPTGALRYDRADGKTEAAAATNEVHPVPDGPLYARGDITLRDASGREGTRELRLALCRCGSSANKPYCDGRHAASGFSDPGAVPQPPAGGAAAASAGALRITVAVNGPLLLEGPVTLKPSGAAAPWQAERLALCRCGGSANKPYCDGNHKRIGFTG